MEDVENDVEFQSMFESKYETGAGPGAARRSPSIANGSSIAGGPSGASLMAAAAGGGPAVAAAAPPTTTAALPVKHGSLGGNGSPGADSNGGGAAHSPNTLLPTHISVFGDGVSGLDLRHAAAAAAAAGAAARHPVQLPSHISEFGGEEDACAGEDAGALSAEPACWKGLGRGSDALGSCLVRCLRAPLLTLPWLPCCLACRAMRGP